MCISAYRVMDKKYKITVRHAALLSYYHHIYYHKALNLGQMSARKEIDIQVQNTCSHLQCPQPREVDLRMRNKTKKERQE